MKIPASVKAFGNSLVSSFLFVFCSFTNCIGQDRLSSVIEYLEMFPPSTWELDRATVSSWIVDLAGTAPSKGIYTIQDRMIELGCRLDIISRVTMFDDDEEFALAADEGVVDETSEQDEQEIQKNTNLMLNMTSVRIFLQSMLQFI